MKAGEYIERVILSKKIKFRFLISLFMINISFSVLPGGIISSYGLVGEVTSFYSIENQMSCIQSKPMKIFSNKPYKALINKEQQKVQYAWLTMIVAILSILYLQYWHAFSGYMTPIVLKIRMNN